MTRLCSYHVPIGATQEPSDWGGRLRIGEVSLRWLIRCPPTFLIIVSTSFFKQFIELAITASLCRLFHSSTTLLENQLYLMYNRGVCFQIFSVLFLMVHRSTMNKHSLLSPSIPFITLKTSIRSAPSLLLSNIIDPAVFSLLLWIFLDVFNHIGHSSLKIFYPVNILLVLWSLDLLTVFQMRSNRWLIQEARPKYCSIRCETAESVTAVCKKINQIYCIR